MRKLFLRERNKTKQGKSQAKTRMSDLRLPLVNNGTEYKVGRCNESVSHLQVVFLIRMHLP